MGAASLLPPIPSSHFEVFLDDHSYKLSSQSQNIHIWHKPGVSGSIPITANRPMTGSEQENWLVFMGFPLAVYLKWLSVNPPPH